MTSEHLWTAMDVAEFLRVSRSWVYLHTSNGELPYLRVGGLVRFDPEAVRAHARGDPPPSTPVVPLRPKVG